MIRSYIVHTCCLNLISTFLFNNENGEIFCLLGIFKTGEKMVPKFYFFKVVRKQSHNHDFFGGGGGGGVGVFSRPPPSYATFIK